MAFTTEQEKWARAARRNLEKLRDSGLFLISHSSSGTIYAVSGDDFDNPHSEMESLDCGKINDMGDW